MESGDVGLFIQLYFLLTLSKVSTATEMQSINEQNRKLAESQEETEEAFILLKTRYDELKGLNFKHVEVSPPLFCLL